MILFGFWESIEMQDGKKDSGSTVWKEIRESVYRPSADPPSTPPAGTGSGDGDSEPSDADGDKGGDK